MNKAFKESDCETRAKLLDAAGQIFAEQGFRGASVRSICRLAGANVAAVNYHFGDKQGLYSQVIAHWAGVARQKYPLDAGDDAKAPPEARLRNFVRTILNRLLDESRPMWNVRLIAQEMVSPTESFDGVVKVFYKPTVEHLREIVREILGRGARDELVHRCTFSILGQCLYYQQARHIIETLVPDDPKMTGDSEGIAEHIINFSLPALRQLAQKKRSAKK